MNQWHATQYWSKTKTALSLSDSESKSALDLCYQTHYPILLEEVRTRILHGQAIAHEVTHGRGRDTFQQHLHRKIRFVNDQHVQKLKGVDSLNCLSSGCIRKTLTHSKGHPDMRFTFSVLLH